jgi:hypothetical protein
VRTLAGIMLVTYVSGMILALELGTKSIIDAVTVHAIQTTLDVPTFLTLVIFSGLSIRLELYKPKYKLPIKKRPFYDGVLTIVCVSIIVAMMLLKYG